MSLTRRSLLTGLVALAPAADAHTLYNQWIVYRRKTLLIGSHRKDMGTYARALQLAEALGHLLPEAAARAARAPHPERLASLLATRQLWAIAEDTPATNRLHVAGLCNRNLTAFAAELPLLLNQL